MQPELYRQYFGLYASANNALCICGHIHLAND